MAKSTAPKELAPAEQPAADDSKSVLLTCEELGVTRAFTPAHAKALQKLQDAKGYSHWQPAAEGATVTE